MARQAAGTPVIIIRRCRWCEKAGRPGAIRTCHYVTSQSGDYYDPENLQHYCENDHVCPTCHHETVSNIVNGRFVADQKCGGRCVNAVGPSCDCSCGGKNHGASYTYHFVPN